EKVAAQCGPDAIWFETDVTDWDALEHAASGTAERFGGIDVVMANAGVAVAGLVETVDPRSWERVIEVNLLGVWRTVRTCLPYVIERRGYVLPVASMAAAVHGPVMSAYCAAKAGVEAFGDSLRSEMRHKGVDVGVAYFSWIATDMVAGGDASPAGGILRGRMKGPLGKTYPLSVAIDAVEHGIETRARRVVAPGWARIMLAMRDFVGPLQDREVSKYMGEVERAFNDAIAEQGAEASAPVGAGGQADTRSRSSSAASG
ncbi:MAG: SDR family NAD(P)-dependent oxidoreductase, partial [Hyalangium sp.]|uniref:SDR family NAD(P)-dependent oxidoreductase n=1 Tax=Hyalangium sp. TaxID=2028555 RepID=UPI00389B0CE2